MAETHSDIPTARKPRWYAPTPAKFLFAVLLMQGVLYLSAHYRWFWFNERKGYTVLITVAATAIGLLLLAGFVFASRFFKSRTQFSLATLLLIVAVMAIPCGWLAREMELARRQREVTKLARSGETEPTVAKNWCTETLGFEFFRDVLRLEFAPKSVTDADLVKFEGLTHLRRLELIDNQVTDNGLEHLKGLTKLQHLNLSLTQVNGAGLKHLKGATQLKVLFLSHAEVSDAGMEHLRGLTQLHTLGLYGTRVSDAGLEHLKGHASLKYLYLNRTQVTDAGLEHLSELKQLCFLGLCGTQVTDAGVERLKSALPNCGSRR